MLIYLIRHAEADYSVSGPYHVAPGPSLTDAGHRQAADTAQLLALSGVERVVSSPMRRCVLTAEAICSRLGLELELDPDLGESQPEESPAEIGVRMLRAALTHASGGSTALVSHATPLEQLIQTLTRGLAHLPPPGHRGTRIGTGEVWQLVRLDGEWRAYQVRPGGVKA